MTKQQIIENYLDFLLPSLCSTNLLRTYYFKKGFIQYPLFTYYRKFPVGNRVNILHDFKVLLDQLFVDGYAYYVLNYLEDKLK